MYICVCTHVYACVQSVNSLSPGALGAGRLVGERVGRAGRRRLGVQPRVGRLLALLCNTSIAHLLTSLIPWRRGRATARGTHYTGDE